MNWQWSATLGLTFLFASQLHGELLVTATENSTISSPIGQTIDIDGNGDGDVSISSRTRTNGFDSAMHYRFVPLGPNLVIVSEYLPLVSASPSLQQVRNKKAPFKWRSGSISGFEIPARTWSVDLADTEETFLFVAIKREGRYFPARLHFGRSPFNEERPILLGWAYDTTPLELSSKELAPALTRLTRSTWGTSFRIDGLIKERRYKVERSRDLRSNNWEVVMDFVATSGNSGAAGIPESVPQSFYRVRYDP